MSKPKHIKLSGFNNRAGKTSLPIFKNGSQRARNAVNVLFDDADNIRFPRWGRTKIYSGNTNWVYQVPFLTLFVEDGDLKSLASDNSVRTLLTGVGDSRMAYTYVGSTVYFSNNEVQGKVLNNVVSEWGVDVPPFQPTATATSLGDMFAGVYRVAITWVGSDGTESGTIAATSVVVAEGGGIQLDGFPAPPDYVTKVAVWLSSVNGEDLYLYAEYPAWLASISLSKHIGTIALETQFGYPPKPTSIIQAHYGRIYYAVGNRLYWTSTRRYGLQMPGDYWTLDSAVQTILSAPSVNTLYVGTEKHIYRYDNIDSLDGSPPIKTEIQDSGSVKYTEAYHPNGDEAFMLCRDRGLLRVTSEGMAELTYNDLAMELFSSGFCSVIEQEGLQYLVFVGMNGDPNPMVNPSFAEDQVLRLGY